MTETKPHRHDASTASGAPTVLWNRLFYSMGIIAAAVILYSALTRSARGFCPGGVDAAGQLVDAQGEVIDSALACAMLTLGPSPVIYLAIIAVVLVALRRAGRAATTEAALTLMTRAVLLVCGVVAASILIAHVWFGLIPLHEWQPGEPNSFVFPFPFGSVELEVTR